MKNTGKAILFIGATIIAIRLFFPVLQCSPSGWYRPEIACPKGEIAFLTFNQPLKNYTINETRTYTQAAGMGVVILTLFFILKRKDNIK